MYKKETVQKMQKTMKIYHRTVWGFVAVLLFLGVTMQPVEIRFSPVKYAIFAYMVICIVFSYYVQHKVLRCPLCDQKLYPYPKTIKRIMFPLPKESPYCGGKIISEH